jgi:anti-anti-sigma factor
MMSSAELEIPLDRLGILGPRPSDPDPREEMARRIEDWIVSNLDDRDASGSPDADWQARFGQLAPLRRSPRLRESATGPGGWTRFRLYPRRGITIVAILDAALVRDDDLAELAADLTALIEAGHHRLVLDFAVVERLSLRAVEALSGPIRDCAARGGALKLSGLRAEVASVVAMTGLASRVEVHPDVSSAIAGPWPESPDLRPLPVTVLSALLQSDRHAAGENSPMIGVRLIAQSEPFEGRVVPVEGTRFVIGRASGSQLRLGFSTVSRHHAAIEHRGGRVLLADLDSTNGTKLNGQSLHGTSAELRDGDEIRIGPLTFAVAIERVTMRRHVEPAEVPERALVSPGQAASPWETSFGTDDLASPLDLPEHDGLKVEIVEGAVVVVPQVADLVAATADVLRDALASLAGRGWRRVVVNLVHIGHISSRAIGVLLAHHLEIGRDGGALRVCAACPRVAAVLEGVRLGMLVECYPTVDDAVLAAWPIPVGDPAA